MRLEFTEEEQAFREEVRAFLREKLPATVRDKVLNGYELSREDHVLWQRTLHERGWGGVGWPQQFGGPGWNAVQQYIFDEETAQAGAPRLIPFGTKMVAPVIMAFGNAAQQQRFLPPISSGAEWWCQGYSEPGAGSDLASLKKSGFAERSLHRQWSEDLEYVGSICRLDFLPGAHRYGGQAAIRHQFSFDRHEESGDHGAAHHALGRRPRGE